MRTLSLSIVSLCVLAGCGGGSSNSSTPVPINSVPTIAMIADLTVSGNGSGSTMISINDDATPVSDLVVSASADSATLLPADGLVLSGTGAQRTLDVVPALDEVGDATVTVTVSDAQGLRASTTFAVSVVPVQTPVAQFTRDLFQIQPTASPVLINALQLVNDAENDGFDDLLASP